MESKTTRQIVVEIERVRVIRKRCKTYVSFCAECEDEVDFITLRGAAELFEIDPEFLNSYVLEHRCHTRSCDSKIVLCLSSLLSRIQKGTEALRTTSFPSKPFQLLSD